MKNCILCVVFLFSLGLSYGQSETLKSKSQSFITPEVMIGQSTEANSLFPERDLQKQLVLGFGTNHTKNPQEWAYRLKAPKTGLKLGYTDFGNSQELGIALTLMPYIEFNIFKRKQNDLKVLLGLGGSYFSTQFDEDTNPFNQAISTDFTWSYRASLLYKFLLTHKIDYGVGLNYMHHSNGHTRLPNQGINSFLLSLSLDVKKAKNTRAQEAVLHRDTPVKSSYNYFSIRYGLGSNVLSLVYNEKKPVNSFSIDYGKVWNKTFKVGLGAYFRHYKHYQDYIETNESLVREGKEFESLKKHPFLNASALGVFIKSEILLNHVGIDMQLGANVFKPTYKVDWRINKGWDNTPREIPDNWKLGEFSTYFKLKHIISTRLGLKYYLIGTDKTPKHNVYIAAHINSNLGQADFSELSMGYVLSFKKK